MDTLIKIARAHKLLIFEDAACGLGAKINGRHVGTYGAWSAFSFHPRKVLQLPKEEFATNSESLANKVRMLRAHGASIDVNKNHESKKYF